MQDLRSRAEAWLERVWYRPQPPPLMLRPWARLYAAALRADRACGRHSAQRLPVPVIVVGSPRVGGSGKTPLVLWLLDWLECRGLRAGVLSRGYGAKLDRPREVQATDSAGEVGDEALLIARSRAVPVCVGPDRVEAGRRLLAGHRLDLLVCDDGLQHWRLERDLEIVVESSRQQRDNGWLLPAGPWRMPADWLAPGALRIAPEPAPAGVFGMRYRNHWLHALDRPDRRRTLAEFAGTQVDALAGIARPERFFATLRAAGVQLRGLYAPGDHRRVSASLLNEGERPLLMTAKDAIKYPKVGRECWWLEHVCMPEDGFVTAMALRIEALGLSTRPLGERQ